MPKLAAIISAARVLSFIGSSRRYCEKRRKSKKLFLPLSPEFRSAPIAVKSLRFAPRLLRSASALRVTAPGASLRGRLKMNKAKENHLSPSSQAGLLPPSPLGTDREGLPSISSSLSNAPFRTRFHCLCRLHNTRLQPTDVPVCSVPFDRGPGFLLVGERTRICCHTCHLLFLLRPVSQVLL